MVDDQLSATSMELGQIGFPGVDPTGINFDRFVHIFDGEVGRVPVGRVEYGASPKVLMALSVQLGLT